MTNLATSFLDATSVAARAIEVPAASFDDGMNLGASNAPGIGIATDVANLTGASSGWTLLDQFAAARTPQDSQHIGGDGLDDGISGTGSVPVDVITVDASGDGSGAVAGVATLASLAAGWSAV